MRTRAALVLVAAAAVAVAAAVAGCGGAAAQKPRPELQRMLNALAVGPHRLVPGAAAYVSGPGGTWAGAAGFANLATRERMTPDARLRLESDSKLWTAVVVLKLVQEHRLRLDDTVERRLPGIFPYGREITIRQLLNHTSGLVDNNDLFNDPNAWLAKIRDPALRARWRRALEALNANPAAQHPARLEIAVAAALPLIAPPGTVYHYSNIGYLALGEIAERASGESLDALYHRVIIDPLRLRSAAYAPGDRWPGAHPVGYLMQEDGTPVAATHWLSAALGAQGAIVSNAADEARFLVALMRGELLPRDLLRALKTPSAASGGVYALGTGVTYSCAGTAFTHNGGGLSWAASVYVSGDGSRVAVLLLNGRPYGGDVAGYAGAAQQLFCAA